MVRHWLRERAAGLAAAAVINAIGCVATAIVAIVVTRVKFIDGAWLVIVLIPILVVADAVHPARVRRPGARAARPRRTWSSRAPHREQRVVIPVNGPQPGRRPGGQVRADPRATTSAPSTSPTDPEDGDGAARRAGSARSRACRWSSSSRRTGRSSGRRSPTSTCSTGLAAGQGGADHDRGAARVRRPPLVGAAALQPDGQAAARRALLGRRAHGRRRRARTAARTCSADGAEAVPAGRRRRIVAAAERGTPRGGGIVARPCPTLDDLTVPSRRASALNGGPSDERIVRLVASSPQDEGGADRGPRGRDRLDAAARCRHRGPLGGRPAGARHGRGDRRESQAADRSPCCSRRATWCGARRRGDRARTPTCSSSGLPYRKRFGGEFAIGRTDPVHPAERAMRGVGRARADAARSIVKIVIVGLRPRRRLGRGRRCGQVPATRSSILDSRPARSSGCRRPSAGPPSAATARTRTSCAGPAPRARTSSSR